MANLPWAVAFDTLSPLLSVAALALLVTILVQAQAVLIPLILAVLLAFILTPLVIRLEGYRLPRIAAVAIVILFALSLIGSFGYVLTRQFNDLAIQLPHYSRSIKDKVATLRASRQGAIANIQKTVKEVKRELDTQERRQQEQLKVVDQTTPASEKNIQPVTVVPPESTDIERLRTMLEPIFAPLATAGMVLIMVIFMLMQREELRNRFLRLVGQGRLTLTTKVMDEAGQRISRFLLTQFLINLGFGTVITMGLLWIGIPYAVLWGVIAALLRFVPYVGAFLAMLLPAALAFVLFDGWWTALATLGLFLLLDLVTANIIEPLLVGHHTGVSSLALLVMALFWTWLWGPIGLVLATPLTVCLAVIGKYVPRLEFLGVLLGDEPALAPEVSYYQRLLASDEDEANEIVEQNLQTSTAVRVCDEVLIPALISAERDYARQEISADEQQFVFREVREAASRLHQLTEAKEEAVADAQTQAHISPARILGIPAHSAGTQIVPDIGAQIVLDMLKHLLDPQAYATHCLSPAILSSEVLSATEQHNPDLICITALPPGGLAQARYLCKRLRARFPEVRIMVVRPGIEKDASIDTQTVSKRLTEAGATSVSVSMAEALTQIADVLPPLLRQPVVTDVAVSADGSAVMASTPA